MGIWGAENSDFDEGCMVFTHFRVPNGVSLGRMSKGGLPRIVPAGASRAKLLSRFGSKLEASDAIWLHGWTLCQPCGLRCDAIWARSGADSYTHLTQPTKRIV